MKLLEDFRAAMGRDPESYEELIGPVDIVKLFRYNMHYDIHHISVLFGSTEKEIKLALQHKCNLSLDYGENSETMLSQIPDMKKFQDTIGQLNKAVEDLDMGQKALDLSELKVQNQQLWFDLKKCLGYIQLTYNLSLNPTYEALMPDNGVPKKILKRFGKLLTKRVLLQAKISALNFEIEKHKALKTPSTLSLN